MRTLLVIGCVAAAVSACNETEPPKAASNRIVKPERVAVGTVIDEMEVAQRQARQRQVEAIDKQIAGLMREISEAAARIDAAKRVLAKIEISRAKFYFFKDPSMKESESEPTIDFHVRNGTETAVRSLYLNVVLKIDGSSSALIDDDLYYHFLNDFAPGESQNLKLAPDRASPWGDRALARHKNFTLTASVTRFERADGETLGVDPDDESTRARARVAALQAQRQRLIEASLAVREPPSAAGSPHTADQGKPAVDRAQEHLVGPPSPDAGDMFGPPALRSVPGFVR
jgi:hypothetical protein